MTVRILGKDVDVKVLDGKIKIVGRQSLQMRGPRTEAETAEAAKLASARYRARKAGLPTTHTRPRRPHTAFGGLGVATRLLFDAALDLLARGEQEWWFEENLNCPMNIEMVAGQLGQDVSVVRAFGYDILRQREDLLAAA